MLDSIYQMTLKILKSCIFGVKTLRFPLILHNLIMDLITFPENLHGFISLPDVKSCDKVG